jgi:hypothetical protein
VTLFPVCPIDLEGNRFYSTGVLAVTGTNAETASITSTGLAAGEALITSTGILNLRNITINPPIDCYGVDIDGVGNPLAVADWFGVNFIGGKAGKIKDIGNFIFPVTGILDPQNGLEISGTIGTIAAGDSIFTVSGAGKKAIAFASDCEISRRIRFNTSAFVASSGATAIDVPETVVINDDSYILSSCNFSGGATYLSGIQPSSLKARFSENRGILNTSRVGGYVAEDNVTATTIAVQGTYYKVAGTTTAIDVNEGFTITNNRATYIASVSKVFHVDFSITFVSGNNNVCSIRLYKNGVPVGSKVKSTANGSGRSENVSGSGAVRFVNGDYVELWITNETSTTAITAADFSLTLTEA